MKTEWIRCPVCGNKTRSRIREHTVLKNFIELNIDLQKIKNGQLLSPWDDLWSAECEYDDEMATVIAVTYTIDKDKTKTKYKREILIPDVVNDYE